MKWRMSVRIDNGVVEETLDYSDYNDWQWAELKDYESSCNGGVWYNVEYDDGEGE